MIRFLSQKLWYFQEIRSWAENECWGPHTVSTFQIFTTFHNFTTKISMPPEPVFQNMGQQMSGPNITQMVRAFGMNTKDGGWVPLLRSRHFQSQKLRHFHKDIHSRVENECYCPRAVNLSNANFTTKIHNMCEIRNNIHTFLCGMILFLCGMILFMHIKPSS